MRPSRSTRDVWRAAVDNSHNDRGKRTAATFKGGDNVGKRALTRSVQRFSPDSVTRTLRLIHSGVASESLFGRVLHRVIPTRLRFPIEEMPMNRRFRGLRGECRSLAVSPANAQEIARC